MKATKNKSGRFDIMSSTSLVEAQSVRNTPEEELATIRVVAGARACRGAGEAKMILEMLGLMERAETAHVRKQFA